MKHTRSWRFVGVAALVGILGACGSTGGGGGTQGPHPTGPVSIAAFNPFSGPDASFGPEILVSCNAAAQLINKAGGINGQHLTCVSSDTHGDPADAVAAAEKLIATTTSLVGIVGPSSDEALATTPIFEHAHIPMFADTGQAAFDKTSLQYFWRVTAADDAKGNAMAIWAIRQGYKHAAAVFGNDAGAQADVPALKAAYAKLGGSLDTSLNVALDQPSYRTEIQQMLAQQPQVIFTETDPQTAATFLSEVVQLNHTLPATIGTETSFQAPYVQAVTQSVGNDQLSAHFVAVQPYAPPTGDAYQVFRAAELAAPGASSSDLSTYAADPFAMSYYDSVNIMALAMVAAGTSDPVTYDKFVSKVTGGASGATKVYSFDQGHKALAQGQQIQYIGASGAISFDAFHNSSGSFQVARLNAAADAPPIGVVTAADIAKVK